MKKISIFLLLVSVTMVLKAQTGAESKVANAVEKLRLAMISGNRADLESIASKDLSYGHSSGKLEDFAAFVETIAGGKSDFVSIDFTKQTIKIAGKTALVRHELHAKTNDGGKPGEVHLGILLVWQKEGKDWKLLGRQAFKLP
ncbi:MAG: nuclear transport factor 2 family protein [Bacteroidota bacterium]